MDDYLSKPFSQEGLRAALQRWMVTKPLTHQPAPQVLLEKQDHLSNSVRDSDDRRVHMEQLAGHGTIRTSGRFADNSFSLPLRFQAADPGNPQGYSDRRCDRAHRWGPSVEIRQRTSGCPRRRPSLRRNRTAREEQLDVAINLLLPLEQSVEMACRIFEGTLRAKAA